MGSVSIDKTMASKILPKDYIWFGPTHLSRHVASALERDLDIESLVAPRALSNESQTVVPLVGFSSLGDARVPELPMELPGPLKGKMSEKEWLADVKIVIDAGLREHWNLSTCICCLCIGQIPSLAPLSALAVLVLLLIAVLTAASGAKIFYAITGLTGGLVLVMAAIVLYISIENVKNMDIERRCMQLSQSSFFREKNLSFGFFATREKRILKPLKYLIVYHEAMAQDSRERMASVSAAQLQLGVLQREYSRSVASRMSINSGSAQPQQQAPSLQPISQAPAPMDQHQPPQKQQQPRVSSSPNPLADHSQFQPLVVRQAPKYTLDPATSGQPVRMPPKQTLGQFQPPPLASTTALKVNHIEEIEEEEEEEEHEEEYEEETEEEQEEEGMMHTVHLNPLREAPDEETLPQEIITRPPKPPPPE